MVLKEKTIGVIKEIQTVAGKIAPPHILNRPSD